MKHWLTNVVLRAKLFSDELEAKFDVKTFRTGEKKLCLDFFFSKHNK